MLPNVPQFVIAYLAAIKLGAILAPINPMSVAREIRMQLTDSGAEQILALDLFLDSVSEAATGTPLKGIVVTSALDCLAFPRRLIARLSHRSGRPAPGRKPGVISWRDLLSQSKEEAPEAPYSLDDPVWLAYTGGVNGRAKAAALSHRNLVANAIQVLSLVPNLQVGGERVLAALPLSQTFGLTACLNAALIARSLVVLLPKFETAKVLREIEKRRITVFLGVPAMFGTICDCPEARQSQLESVRVFFSGGAPLTSDLQRRFEDLAGKPLANCYGLTEASPAVTGMPPTLASMKPGSVGKPLPGATVAVLDARTLEPLPAGQTGELAVKGPQVMLGYWRAEEETKEVIRKGWLLTGDLASLDEDGFVYLAGRRKRMINVGGFKVYPQELEAVLNSHPAIRSAVVTGIANGYRGEIVKAVITPAAGKTVTRADVVAYCRSQLARFKAPKIIEIRADDEAAQEPPAPCQPRR